MSEHEIFLCLKSKYGGNDYALIPQVRNSTGFAARVRTADAIAVSLWPSRGIGIEGFEFKDSRNDWKKELSEPQKAEEISRFCMKWWVVVTNPSIVMPGELPPTWGLMHAAEGSVKVIAKAKQPMPDSQPPAWAFIASLLRAASEVVVPEAEIQKRIRTAENVARKIGYDDGLKESTRQARSDALALETIRKTVKQFEEASGIRLDTYGQEFNNRRIATAVRLVLNSNPAECLDNQITHLQSVLDAAKAAREEMAGAA
jgi:hypothetical protein